MKASTGGTWYRSGGEGLEEVSCGKAHGRLLDMNKKTLWLEHRVRTIAAVRPEGQQDYTWALSLIARRPLFVPLTAVVIESPEHEVFSWKSYTMMACPSFIPSPITFKVGISQSNPDSFCYPSQTSNCCLCTYEEPKGRPQVPYLFDTGARSSIYGPGIQWPQHTCVFFFYMEDLGCLISFCLCTIHGVRGNTYSDIVWGKDQVRELVLGSMVNRIIARIICYERQGQRYKTVLVTF